MRKIHGISFTLFFLIFSLCSVANSSLNEWQKDLFRKNQKLLKSLKWEKLKKLDKRNNSQTIAIIGSGISVTDFKSFFLINKEEIPGNGLDDDNNGHTDDYLGFNFSKENGDINSISSGHESGIASLVALLSNFNRNKKFPIKILPLKISMDANRADHSFLKKIADAIDYAVLRGVRVISVSQGISKDYGSFFRFVDNDVDRSIDYIQAAIDRAYNAGTLIFASPSNDSGRDHLKENHFPATMNHVISVANVNFKKYIRSGYGLNITTAFWGTDIYVYEGKRGKTPYFPFFKFGGMVKTSGTSYATPMVATFVAIALTQQPYLSVDEIEREIINASNIPLKGRRRIQARGSFSPLTFFNLLLEK